MTNGAEPPNYFLILGIDPDAPWDQVSFERVLAENRSRWTIRRNGIRTNPETIEARRNLGHLRDIERVMRDPELRRLQQAAARESQADTRRWLLEAFARKLELITAKGFLYDIELQALQAEMSAIGADSTLGPRLRGIGVRPFKQARANQERLDSTTELVLRANLATLGEPSLYAALARVDGGINETSSRDQLLAAADGLYRKALNTADKTKPEVGAMQQLSGQAKQIFGDDDLARRYKSSLLLAPLDELAEEYESHLGLVSTLDASQVEQFLHTAAQKRIDPDLAREFLLSYFGERNWRIELPSAAVQDALRMAVCCPRCRTLNEPDTSFCHGCGRIMREQCPVCRFNPPAGARNCPHCGFPIGNRDLAVFFVDEAESYLGREDIAGATEQLIQAERAWPTGPGSDSDLALLIRSTRESITRLQGVRDYAAKHIAELMRDDQYRSALLELRGLTFPLPSAGSLIAECELKVRQAGELFLEGDRPGGSDERKVQLYLQALRICKDYEPATLALASIPPEPPDSLRVTVDEDRMVVRLAWEQGSAADCTWVVVRADGVEAPASAADLPGQRVSRAGTSQVWTDIDPVIGAPVRYAVFTQRGPVLSARAAIWPDVIFLVGQVELTARPADRAVDLTWTVPPNADGVELQREEAGSSSAPIYLPAEREQRQLLDKNVRNGVRYRYTIRARFADATGGRPGAVRYSPAAVAEATPSRPPEPPRPPYAQGGPPDFPVCDHKVVLRWPAPERGVIWILRAKPQISLLPGDDLTEVQLDDYGYVIKDPAPPYSDLLRGAGAFHAYFPVLVVDGRCRIGHPRRYLADAEVGDLTAEHRSTSVRLRWAWPPVCDEALVAWDENSELADPLAGPLQARVPRTPGEATGSYDLPVHTARMVFVLVAAVARAHGREFISSGAAISIRRSLKLRYQIRLARGPGGRRGELLLSPERPAWLPALELRGRADGRPASQNDPLLLSLPAGQSERELVRKFPLGSALPRSCRLFVASPDDGDSVEIIDPD